MRVIVESPFAGGFANVKYAREAVRDCIDRGESPFASHLLYTQKGLLDDKNPGERRKGIDAAIGWLQVADYVAVYVDLGITPGMVVGIVRAAKMGKPIRLRWIKRKPKQEEVVNADTGLRDTVPLDDTRSDDLVQVRETNPPGNDGLRSLAEIITGPFSRNGPNK